MTSLIALPTILFDGIAYGMLLFVMALGLSVTMGLMGVVNLAHGAFAALGGYVTALMMTRLGAPFLATLPVAFLGAAALGAVLERVVYRHLYARPHLDQVLATLGLVFMATAAADFLIGPQQQMIQLPGWLQGRWEIGPLAIGRYRLFVTLICAALALGLQALLVNSRAGALLRAAVDDTRVARGLGVRVGRLFALVFALGCGLAGLGGALAVEMLGVDPGFPLRFLVPFLIVVVMGGTGTLTGPLAAALLVGIVDVAGKYYAPQLGAFLIYALMIAVLILRPQGLGARP